MAFKGYADIAELLIVGGAAVEADNGGGSTPFSTPLMYAVMFGRANVAEVLCRHGAGLGRSRSFGLLARGAGRRIRLVRR